MLSLPPPVGLMLTLEQQQRAWRPDQVSAE